MDFTAILNGAVGAGVLAIILKLIDIYSTRGKAKAEATDAVVDTMLDAMQFLRTERGEYLPRLRALEASQSENEKLIKELQNHRDERTRQIAELTENNEALNAQVAALQMRIAKDTDETRELKAKYQELKDFTKSLIEALEKRGIELPELNGKIPDSISGWKKPK